MRYIGIDYGSKRVGIAISDEEGMMAFPYKIIENDTELLNSIHNICVEEGIDAIVIGESVDSSGMPNKIMKEINKFKNQLNSEVGLPIHMEKEFMTSLYSNLQKTKDIFSARQNKKEINKKNDSHAATLILQRFLDKNK